MMAPTDSLPLIAKTYELELETLLKWNGIKEIKQCYPGMRLIVRKANPDQLTKAELAEFDKQRRQMNGIKQTDKKIHELHTFLNPCGHLKFEANQFISVLACISVPSVI